MTSVQVQYLCSDILVNLDGSEDSEEKLPQISLQDICDRTSIHWKDVQRFDPLFKIHFTLSTLSIS